MNSLNTKIWEVTQRLKFLEWLCVCDPGDYMSQFERDELRIKLHKLNMRNVLSLVVLPPIQSTSSSTEKVS